MASRRYPKRTKMRSFSVLDSLSLFCAVVIVATLGSLHVNGEKDLCNKFKSGEQQIVLMAQTNDTFYILAADNTGYKAPLERFQLFNDHASLDLSGLQPFTLDTKGANLPKPDNGKGVFLSWFPIKDTKLRPWLGLHVAFLSEAHKRIIFVPVDNEKQDKVLTFAIDARQLPPSNVFISTFTEEGYWSDEYGNIYLFGVLWALETKLSIEDYVLASNEIQFNNAGVFSNYSMSTVDSGWNCGKNWNFCSIKNAEKKVLVNLHYKEPTVVPFKDFFQCLSDADLKAAKIHKIMIIIGIACVLVLIALFVLCYILSKDKSKSTSTSNSSTANSMVRTVNSKALRKLKVKKAGGKAKPTSKSSTFSPAFKGKAKYKIGKR